MTNLMELLILIVVIILVYKVMVNLEPVIRGIAFFVITGLTIYYIMFYL